MDEIVFLDNSEILNIQFTDDTTIMFGLNEENMKKLDLCCLASCSKVSYLNPFSLYGMRIFYLGMVSSLFSGGFLIAWSNM